MLPVGRSECVAYAILLVQIFKTQMTLMQVRLDIFPFDNEFIDSNLTRINS